MTNLIVQNGFPLSSQEVADKITSSSSSIDSLMHLICYTEGNILVVDYRYFKHIANPLSYQTIMKHVIAMIDYILESHPNFSTLACIKSLTVSDVDKHMTFIKSISNALKTRYQNKMTKCSIYNAPFIFAQVYNIVSCFIDKDTLEKITMIPKSDKR